MEPAGTISIGRVFARTLDVLRTHPLTVLGAALLLGALPGYGLDLLLVGLAKVLNTDTIAPMIGVLLASAAVKLMLAMVVQGAIAPAVVAHAAGSRAGPGRPLLAGLARAVPLAVLGIVSGVWIVLGLGLFLVPGAMLFVMWAVAGPALVAERRGVFGALGRSQDLTRGARWSVLGIELLALVFYYLASSVVAIIGLARGAGATWLVAGAGAGAGLAVLSIATTTLRIALWSALQAALYVELRDRHDGPGARALATIFG